MPQRSKVRPAQSASLREGMEPIVTERLLLRPLSVQDVTAAYVDALHDPEVLRWTEARHIWWDRDRVIQFVRQSNVEGVSILFGMFLKDTDRHIGNLRLFNFHPVHRRAELSFLIFDKSQWSKGYATEAVRAVTHYAFETLKLHRIHADYYALNAGSARVFEKSGYEIEGVFKEHMVVDGSYMDSVRIAKLNHGEV